MEHPERVILVAGAGRSGTTWLGKLLDASPQVLYKNEPDNWAKLPFFRDVPSRLDPTPDNARHRDAYRRGIAECFWTHSTDFYRPPEFEKDFLRNGLFRLETLALRARRKLGSGVPVQRIPRFVFKRPIADVRLVMKSVISNLRLAWIHEHFPEIRLVMIIRHPGAYVSSWLRGQNQEGWSGFGDRARLDETVLPFPHPDQERYRSTYENGSDLERELVYWLVANETPVLALADSPRLKLVVYEDLCADPEGVLRGVYEHCDVPFGDSARKFVQASTSVHEDAYRSVLKDPTRTVNRWRDELSAEEIAVVEQHLGASFLSKYWPRSVAA